MLQQKSPHTHVVLQALLVTFLWSTSWVLIKLGLADIPAVTFAGLRYGLAFLCLLPFALRPADRAAMRALTARQWLLLAGYGMLFYGFVQGAQYVSLVYLRLGMAAWIGVLLSVVGGSVFFYPIMFSPGQTFGLMVAMICMLGNALSAVLGRFINHHQKISALTVTLISMGVGSSLLLAATCANPPKS